MSSSVVILGGGIVGTATAYYLARRGYSVTVVEREANAGLGTSFANGGLMTPSMADPWAAPGLPLKLLRWMGRENSPFLLRPAALPGMLSWGMSFLRNCTDRRWRRNAEVIYRLAAYSQRETAAVTADTGIVYDRSSVGTLRLFRDASSMSSAQRGAALVGELGCHYRSLSPEQCAELEPALVPELDRVAGGIHFPDDESGDAHKFTRELAGHCQSLGVKFRYGVTVERIAASGTKIEAVHTDAGPVKADRYVLALASASTALVRPLGIKLPIYPVKGYSATISIKGWNGAPSVPIVDDARKLGITRLGDRLRLAGTAEFAGFDRRLNARRGKLLLDSMLELFPGFTELDNVQHWTGLRPMTPDGIPVIGATPYWNLFVNSGQGHLGFTMACGSARVVADVIDGSQPEIDTKGLGMERA